jgi:hypothetical protein
MSPRQSIFFGWRVVCTAFVIAMFAWGVGFYGPKSSCEPSGA